MPARVRAAVLRRDSTCRLAFPGCLGQPSQVHHLRPPSDELEDLIGVCAPCHAIVTRAEAAAAQWGGTPEERRRRRQRPAL
jgi:5-methylcytosine-specific restriction endonuclease McrA